MMREEDAIMIGLLAFGIVFVALALLLDSWAGNIDWTATANCVSANFGYMTANQAQSAYYTYPAQSNLHLHIQECIVRR